MYDVYKYLFYLIFISNGSSFVVVFAVLLLQIDHSTQECADGGCGGASCPHQYFQICKKVGQKGQPGSKWVGHSIFCDLVVFSNNLVTIVGQLVRTPPQQKVSRHITYNTLRDRSIFMSQVGAEEKLFG